MGEGGAKEQHPPQQVRHAGKMQKALPRSQSGHPPAKKCLFANRAILPAKVPQICLLANRATLPPKWPPTPRNVADSCELTATNKPTQPTILHPPKGAEKRDLVRGLMTHSHVHYTGLYPQRMWGLVVPDKSRCWRAGQKSSTPPFEGCAALRVVLVTVPRASRSYENFPDGFDLHLLHTKWAVLCGSSANHRN